MRKARYKTRAAWKKFRMGEHLSDAEMEMLAESAQEGVNFLEHHPDMGCAFRVAVTDLNTLNEYLYQRKVRGRNVQDLELTRGVN